MIELLSKIFIKNRDDPTSPETRRAYGTLCGTVGIAFNILLSIAKLIGASLTGSVSVAADAMNNLSDAGSSAVTLVGFRLAGQKPDHTHPFGHGRIEYISGFIVSMIIILMGFELGKSSVEKIISRETSEFSVVTVVILALSIAVKLYMYLYNTAIAKKISSAAMRATAADSLSDCIATGAVLVCTVVSGFSSLPLDGWCGLAVSVFILRSGIMTAKDTLDPLLGTPPDAGFVDRIKSIVMSYPEVSGMHDLIVHNYGPGRTMISLHAEVPQTVNILEIHDTIDNIERRLASELNCNAVIHMDPIATDDELTVSTREKVAELVRALDPAITIHDFRMVVGQTHTNLIFDMVIPFAFRLSDNEVKAETDRLVKVISPDYHAVVNIDKSYTD